MIEAYVVTDEDGNVYGPYASLDEAADLCDSMFEDRISCDINVINFPDRDEAGHRPHHGHEK